MHAVTHKVVLLRTCMVISCVSLCLTLTSCDAVGYSVGPVNQGIEIAFTHPTSVSVIRISRVAIRFDWQGLGYTTQIRKTTETVELRPRWFSGRKDSILIDSTFSADGFTSRAKPRDFKPELGALYYLEAYPQDVSFEFVYTGKRPLGTDSDFAKWVRSRYGDDLISTMSIIDLREAGYLKE